MAIAGERRISVSLIGPVAVRIDGTRIDFPTRHCGLLIALLAAEPSGEVPRERLAEILWGDRGKEQANGSLRQTVYRTRRVLREHRDLIESRGRVIRLDPDRYWCDLRALRDAPAGTIPIVADAEVMEGCDGVTDQLDAWLGILRADVSDRRRKALVQVAAEARTDGNFALVADLAQRLLRMDPFDETALRLRLDALARQGRGKAAADEFQRFADRLETELAAEPEPETVRLSQAIATRLGHYADGAATQAVTLPPRRTDDATEVVRSQPERRPVTVIAVRPPAMTDPEEIARDALAMRTDLEATAQNYGGTLLRTPGGLPMAVFGWPDAIEGAAERGLRAALELRGKRHDAAVGAASGEVLAEPSGMLVGAPPDTALRLALEAGPGQVRACETTCGLARLGFDFEHDGGAHVLVAERSAEGRFAARHRRGAPPIFGREAELQLLLDRWRSARSGEGQVVLITGEAGIGKSRLIEALAEDCSATASRRTLIQCSAFATDTAFGPVVEHLEIAAGLGTASDAGARRQRLGAYLASVDITDPGAVETVAEFLDNSASDDRHRGTAAELQEILVDLLVGSDGKCLLVVEDMHWADPSTRDLVVRVAAVSSRRGVLVVLTARPEFRIDDLPGHLTMLSLRPLGRADTAALVRTLTGETASTEAVEAICDRCDGIPFFAEELARAIRENRGDAAPTSLRDLLMIRLDRLGTAKSVAQSAACIGRRFSRESLSAVAGLDGEALGAALATMEQSGVVFPAGRSHYVFRHMMLRDAAYESLTRDHRRATHRALFAHLAASADVDPGTVARHAVEAGLDADALVWLRRAGEAALRRFATREAETRFEQALAVLDESGQPHDATRLELLGQIAHCQAHIWGYGHSRTIEAFDRARAMALRLPASPQSIPVLWQTYSAHYVRGDAAAASVVGEEILHLPAWNDAYGPQRTVGLRFVAAGRMLLGEFEQALAQFDAAEEELDRHGGSSLADPVGIDHRIAIGLHRARCLACLGRPGEARRILAATQAEARGSERPHSLIMTLALTCVTMLVVGDHRETRRLAAECQQVAQSSEAGMWLHYARLFGTVAEMHLSPSADVVTRYGAIREEFDRTRTRASVVLCDALFADALARYGDLSGGAALVAEARRMLDQGTELWCRPLVEEISQRIAATGNV